MAIAVTKTTSSTPANGTTGAVTITGVAQGACLIFVGFCDDETRSVSSMQAAGTAAFSIVGAKMINQNATSGHVYMATNVASGDYSLTVTWSGTASSQNLFLVEVGGATTTSVLDVYAQTQNIGNATSASATTSTTNQANELVVAIGFAHLNDLARPISALGGSWTTHVSVNNTTNRYTTIASQRVTSTGTQTVTFSSGASNQQWMVHLMTMIEQAAGGGGAPLFLPEALGFRTMRGLH